MDDFGAFQPRPELPGRLVVASHSYRRRERVLTLSPLIGTRTLKMEMLVHHLKTKEARKKRRRRMKMLLPLKVCAI